MFGGDVPLDDDVAQALVWGVDVGVLLQQDHVIRNMTQGSMVRWGAAAGLQLLEDRILQVGVETFGATVVEDTEGEATSFELLGAAKIEAYEGLKIGAAAGPGLTSAAGTPDYRVLFGVTYSHDFGPNDRDGDGIPNEEDACPNVPGVPTDNPKTHGCPPDPDSDGDGIVDKCDDCPTVAGEPREGHGCPPPPDRDGDGIADDDDACPDKPGVPTGDPKTHGCPPDRDGDGILDADDACPCVPGVPSKDPRRHGCPADRDGDGIFDKDDACPDKPGKPNADPKKHGCPLVRLTATEIKIIEQVQFEIDKAIIRPESDPLLDNVADILKKHPELEQVEVQGHTSSTGTPEWNMGLSRRRAKAVMAALVKRGIAPARLVSKGYGLEKPIATNDTHEGRALNRRVQFVILKKK